MQWSSSMLSHSQQERKCRSVSSLRSDCRYKLAETVDVSLKNWSTPSNRELIHDPKEARLGKYRSDFRKTISGWMVLQKRRGPIGSPCCVLACEDIMYGPRNRMFTVSRITVRIGLWNPILNGKEHILAMKTIKCIREIRLLLLVHDLKLDLAV